MKNEPSAPKSPQIPRQKIEVKEKDIRESCRKNANRCMIASAIRKQFPEAQSVYVDMLSIRWSDPERGLRYTYMTPKPVQNALIRFDMGLEIKPFYFQVRSGQVSGMRIRNKRVQLGRPRKTEKEENGAIVITKFGGVPPPRGVPPHPSAQHIRHFGAGYFTKDYVKGWTDKPKE